nr:uncharacterized protein LOC118879663 isoform X1 [Drosophila suzukii]
MYILVFVFFLRNYFTGFQPGRVPPAFGLPSRPFSAQSGHFGEITPSLPHRKQNLLHSTRNLGIRVLLQVSSTPSTTETPLYFDALLPKFVYRVRRVAASHGCSHPRSLPAVAHVEEARASFRVPSGGHGTDPSEPCAAGPKCPFWTGVHVPSTTPSLCPIRERGSCAELHSTDIDAAAAGTPDGTRSRPRNGHRPRRRMRGSSGPLGCSGFRCRLPRWRITVARPENPPSFDPRCAMAVRGDRSCLPDDTAVIGSGCCRSLASHLPAVEVAAWAADPAAFGRILLSPAAAEFPLDHLRRLLDTTGWAPSTLGDSRPPEAAAACSWLASGRRSTTSSCRRIRS